MGRKDLLLNKIAAIFVALTLVVTLIPIMCEKVYVKAAPNASAVKNERNTCIGTTSIANPKYGSGGWSYVYFGKYDNDKNDDIPARSVKYKVLSNNTTEYSNGNTDLHTMFLDSIYCLKEMQFDTVHAYSQVWKDSDVYRWLNDTGREDSFINECLSEVERSSLISSYIAQKDLVVGTGDNNVDQWTHDKFLHSAELTGEKVFVLDVAEVSRLEFGYPVDHICDWTPRNKYNYKDLDRGYGSTSWWLRSPLIDNPNYIASVSNVMTYSRNDGAAILGVAPALNIDLSTILFSTAVKGNLGENYSEYKLTLKDPGLSIKETPDMAPSYSKTNTGYSIGLYYTLTGDPDQVSIIITDGDLYAEGTKIKNYSKLYIYEQTYNGVLPKEGYGSFPTGMDYDPSTDKIYMLAEKINGEDETDYASEPVEIFVKYAENTKIGTGTISNPKTKGRWNYTYLGHFDPDGTGPLPAEPVRYRILKKETDVYSGDLGGKTMFLDCDMLIKRMKYNNDPSYSNEWKDSYIYLWLNDESSNDSFINSCFSAAERSAIISSYKKQKDLVPGFLTDNIVTQKTYDDFKTTTALTGEKIFILDVAEVERNTFGYYVSHGGADYRVKKDYQGNEWAWWLRSPYVGNESYTGRAGVIASDGEVLYTQVDGNFHVSPAFNIDVSKILFSSIISGTEGEPGAEHKLTIKDDSLSLNLISGKEVTVTGNEVTVPCSIRGNVDYVSYIITNGDINNENTVIKFYNDLYFKVSGSFLISQGDRYGTFKIPDVYDPSTDKIYVFAENRNNAKEPDFASNLIEIKIGDASAIKITQQPEDATVEENQIAEFDVKAEGNDLKYLWQYKLYEEYGDGTWVDWTSKTTPAITVAYASYRNKMWLRCKITDKNGNQVTTDEVRLYYTASSNSGPVITEQPKNATVNSGELAFFSVKASGDELKYLWQYKELGKENWVDWTTKTTADINVAYASYRNGMSLRCIITDKNGKKVTSDTAVLKYTMLAEGPVITQQPQNTMVAKNELAYFRIKVNTKTVHYLWQYKLKGDSAFTDWTTKTTAEINVAYAAYRDGMTLRCKVTDLSGNTVFSNEAVLTYSTGKGPMIITQPKDTTVAKGKLAYFNVLASGADLKYLWQYKQKGQTEFTNWTTKTQPMISVAYATYRNGMVLRCIVIDKNGNSVISNEAVLKYVDNSGPIITKQPQSATVGKNELAYFSVKATGNELKYLWQYKLSGESTFTDWTTKTTADISVAYAEYRNGMALRCIITDKNGNKVTSDEAILSYR
ncbi:MAG: DUF6273 domain-containing protein [Lachnospiraceae bacterium]|nr:DUF6273 domain-containing protein [Lachnospiraceae bacterium]